MHSKQFFVFLYFFLSSFHLQSKSERPEKLHEILSELASAVGEVKTEKTTYRQSFTFDRDRLWQAELQVVEVNNRNGKSCTLEYQLNLGDLDPHLVRLESKRDE